ncbi:MAG TPA: ATP-binding protein [Candidatus Saccharimonadales bacterium]|nr:ATP-binding protein [Candidatus Saccharimonadales bacterium]
MSTKMNPLPRADLDEMYASALEDYFRQADERCLHRAYELGRQAVREGRSILEMIELNRKALVKVLQASPRPAEGATVVEASMAFFKEAMSPYEMTNRAFGEATAALENVDQALEGEARRIAHLLHDEAGQLLAAVHIRLEDIGRSLPARARERLQEVRQVLDQIEDQLRGLAHELHPPALEDQGLLAVLENLAAVVTRRSGLRVTVESAEPQRLPRKIETAMYRIVQEALKNASKHARANSVHVRLWCTGACVHCSIEDDGVGFDQEAVSSGKRPHGLGLLGIRERLQALGGSFEIRSAPGQGARLSVRVPLES